MPGLQTADVKSAISIGDVDPGAKFRRQCSTACRNLLECASEGAAQMESIFVSASFHDPDRALVNQISEIIKAFGAQPREGRRLGGQQLEDAIKQKIEGCDGLVALFTRRNQGDGFETHPWVQSEFQHAHDRSIPALAILESGLDWGQSPWPGRAYVALDRGRPAEALVALAAELGEWKRNAGLDLIATVTTPEVIGHYLDEPDRLKVEYRTIYKAIPEKSWRETNRIYLDGAALAIALPRILSSEHIVEMRVTWGNNQKKWYASGIRQSVPVQLREMAP
jgi:hypothetical protein